LSLTPVNYEQILQLRRQQFALREQERSPQYEKQLTDLARSIAQWHDWRQRHPGPGTITALRAHARWLAPLFATVANPLLLANPWLYGALAVMVKEGSEVTDLYDRWAVRIAVRGILRDGGVKRRG
jgi:hypothetical protein